MQTIADALREAVELLGVDTAKLDAECLLSAVIGCDRAYLIAWPERRLTDDETREFRALLRRRACGEPVAYLLGRQEFWSLTLQVTKDVLIPRSETELLVEYLLRCDDSSLIVADIGTGSGAIALALAKHKPQWTVIGADISLEALSVAKANGESLLPHRIAWLASDYLSAFASRSLDIVVSNPPYIAEHDPDLHRDVLRYEPKQALIAEQNGLASYSKISAQAAQVLKLGGSLVLEHGYKQREAVASCLLASGFTEVCCHSDLAGLPRMTVAVLGA